MSFRALSQALGRPRPPLGMLRADPGLGRALSLAIVCAAVVALPVLSVFASFWQAGESADTLRHLLATVIPSALVETSLLGVGRHGRRRRGGRCHRVAGGDVRLPGSSGFRMGAAAAARDAGVHRRVRVHRLSAIRRTFAAIFARQLRLAARRLLVSGDSIADGRGVRIHRRAVSVRVSACAHRISGAHSGDDGCGAQPRTNSVANMVARQSAAGASGDCGRCAARADGDDRRLRSSVVLRVCKRLRHRSTARGSRSATGLRRASWPRCCCCWCWCCSISSIGRAGVRGSLRRRRASVPRRALRCAVGTAPLHSRCARRRSRSDSSCRCCCCCDCSDPRGKRSTGRATPLAFQHAFDRRRCRRGGAGRRAVARVHRALHDARRTEDAGAWCRAV